MARVGEFDATLSARGWFDVTDGNPLNGFLDKDAIGAGSAPPPVLAKPFNNLSRRPHQMLRRIR